MTDLIVGCDISKGDIHVAIVNIHEDKIIATRKFPNNVTGFSCLMDWAELKAKGYPFTVICEATGVYHENLVDFIYSQNIVVYVITPKVIKNYIKGRNYRVKNDKSDAVNIAFFGATIGSGKSKIFVKPWEPFSPYYKEIRCNYRMLRAIDKELKSFKCRMEALRFANNTPKEVIEQMDSLIKELEESIEITKSRLQKIISQDPELSKKIDKITATKGIGWQTVIAVVSETNGFRMFSNSRQLTAFAGLDIPEIQSGRCRKPGAISKCGSASIRQALYMPAMSMAAKSGGIYHPFYCRLKERYGHNKGNGRKAITAVMRKLLCLIYTLWITDTEYNPNYKWKPKCKKDSTDNLEAGASFVQNMETDQKKEEAFAPPHKIASA